MQALPPPPPITCVRAADAAATGVRMLITVSGNADLVTAWYAGLSGHNGSEVEADVRAGNERSITIKEAAELSYREIGEMIYLAQSRRLVVTVEAKPPICEFKNR